MRWLYRILRIFFCPHRWHEFDRIRVFEPEQSHPFGDRYVLQCRYCGKLRVKIVE
jgi:hypothetical protein